MIGRVTAIAWALLLLVGGDLRAQSQDPAAGASATGQSVNPLELQARAKEVTRLRAANKPTIPTLLGEEKKANVFLRADEPSVAASVRMKGKSAAEVFGELRERKNKS